MDETRRYYRNYRMLMRMGGCTPVSYDEWLTTHKRTREAKESMSKRKMPSGDDFSDMDALYGSRPDFPDVRRETEERLEADNRVLREALAALVEGEDAGLSYCPDGHENMEYVCTFCSEFSQHVADFAHAPDCPIVRGREALAKVEA